MGNQTKKYAFWSGLLLFVFLVAAINNVSAEPCWGYTVNSETSECVFGLLYSDGGSPPEYSNCYIVDVCTDEKNFEWDPSKMNCTYRGCVNNCKENETTASVASIGCIGKNNITDDIKAADNNSFPIIIGAVILLLVALYCILKKIRKK